MKIKFWQNWRRSPIEIAIEYEQGLSDAELKDFRKAVDYYRKGDKLQLEEYDKGNKAISGKPDDIDSASAALEGVKNEK